MNFSIEVDSSYCPVPVFDEFWYNRWILEAQHVEKDKRLKNSSGLLKVFYLKSKEDNTRGG